MIRPDELFIENYRYRDCEPMQNIMRLPREEAFELAGRLAREHENTTAFYRFADFENYYPKRLEADSMLLEQFVALGGRPLCEHPLSFVLEGSDYLRKWFGGGVTTRLPLAPIPSRVVSFVYGDSMGVLKRCQPLKVVAKEALMDAVARYGGTLADFMRDIERQCVYIEAQLWDDSWARGAAQP